MFVEKLKLSPPWVTYVNKLMALFGEDPDIKIVYDEKLVKVKLYVAKAEKAAALDYLLPREYHCGGSYLIVTVIYSSEEKDVNLAQATVKELFDTAFDGNPVYSFSRSVNCLFSNTITYVVFKNKVIQFFNDNLNDVYGNLTTLYENIARDIFVDYDEVGPQGVFYCTDIPEGCINPLGEWP